MNYKEKKKEKRKKSALHRRELKGYRRYHIDV
jgi:hypothetical protein